MSLVRRTPSKFSSIIKQMTPEQVTAAEEIVRRVDTVTLMTCDEVKEVYKKILKGELNA